MKKFFFIITIIIGFIPIYAQNIIGKADKQKYMVGDYIQYEFAIPKSNKNLTMSSNFKFGDTLQMISSKIDTNQKNYIYKFTFASFVEGQVKLPEFQFYERSAVIPAINVNSPIIEITFPQIDTSKVEVKPLKNIFSIPLTLKELITISFLVIILAAIIIGIIYFVKNIKKRKKETPQRPKIIVSEDIEALNNIDRLKQAHLIEKNQVKQHYIALSEILWQYIYRRYKINAFEMTTTQINKELDKKDISLDNKQKVNKIFSISDLVKFAKYIPENRTNAQLLDYSVEFINSTKRIIETKEDKTNKIELNNSLTNTESEVKDE